MPFAFVTPFMKTQTGQCRFFVREETGMHASCCGRLTRKDRSYCDEHHALTHEPVKRKRRNNGMLDRSIHHKAFVEESEPDLTEIVQ